MLTLAMACLMRELYVLYPLYRTLGKLYIVGDDEEYPSLAHQTGCSRCLATCPNGTIAAQQSINHP